MILALSLAVVEPLPVWPFRPASQIRAVGQVNSVQNKTHHYQDRALEMRQEEHEGDPLMNMKHFLKDTIISKMLGKIPGSYPPVSNVRLAPVEGVYTCVRDGLLVDDKGACIDVYLDDWEKDVTVGCGELVWGEAESKYIPTTTTMPSKVEAAPASKSMLGSLLFSFRSMYDTLSYLDPTASVTRAIEGCTKVHVKNLILNTMVRFNNVQWEALGKLKGLVTTCGSLSVSVTIPEFDIVLQSGNAHVDTRMQNWAFHIDQESFKNECEGQDDAEVRGVWSNILGSTTKFVVGQFPKEVMNEIEGAIRNAVHDTIIESIETAINGYTSNSATRSGLLVAGLGPRFLNGLDAVQAAMSDTVLSAFGMEHGEIHQFGEAC